MRGLGFYFVDNVSIILESNKHQDIIEIKISFGIVIK